MNEPVPIAAIDAGSNAIRATVAHAIGGHEFLPIASERIPVRLGSGAFTHGEIPAETIDAAVAAFSRFRKLFDLHGVRRFRAVATSATRTARNQETLIGRIQHETGILIDVIDGREEARLVRDAVTHAFDAGLPPMLMDLGGGSLEIAQLRGRRESTSVHLGTVRLLEVFRIGETVDATQTALLAHYIDAKLAGRRIAPSEDGTAAICGGNADALAGLFGSEREDGLWEISCDAVLEAAKEILHIDVPARMERWGVREDRADVMGVAALIFGAAARLHGVHTLIAPGVGLREGILHELCANVLGTASPMDVSHAALASARAFCARVKHTSAHGEHVRRMARMLFVSLADIHRVPDEYLDVLELAALLHDVGEVVNRSGHHRHSEYMVQNARLPGLEEPRRSMVAALCRAHRRSLPNPEKHSAFASLPEPERDIVRRLVPVLRMADAFDTDHRRIVRGLDVRPAADGAREIRLLIPGGRQLTAAPFERRNRFFEEQFGVRLTTTLVPWDDPHEPDDLAFR